MKEAIVLLIAGPALIAWAGYQLVQAYRIGEIAEVHYLHTAANRNDPPAWFWFIVFINVAWLALGFWMVMTGVELWR